MAFITYQVIVRDHAGAKVTTFIGRGLRGLKRGGMQSFSYRKRLRTAGAFTIQVQGYDERVEMLALDYFFEFWRRDPQIPLAHIATLPLYMRDPLMGGWYLDFCGFLRTEPEYTLTADGTYTATLRGRGLNDLFSSEPITYPKNSTQAAKTGAAETVAKAYVNENIGPGAGLDAEGNSRVRQGLTVEATAGTGAAWEGDRANKLLSEVLSELGNFAPGDYNLVYQQNAAMEFQWRDMRWGLDRTDGNGVNVPIIFSARLNNIGQITSSRSYLNDVNVVNVLGQGVGDNNKVRAVSGASLALSPWSRRAITIEDRNAVEDTAMDNLGYAELNARTTTSEIDVQVLQSAGVRYGPDPSGTRGLWDYGDFITVEDTVTGRQVNKKIVGVTVSLSSANNETIENISPEFEDDAE